MTRSPFLTLGTAVLAMLAAACATPVAPESEAGAAPAFTPQDAKDIVAMLGEINTPNGVNEAITARIGGIDQALTIHGKDKANPILIVVHGGPGTPEMAMSWTCAAGKIISPSCNGTSAAPARPTA